MSLASGTNRVLAALVVTTAIAGSLRAQDPPPRVPGAPAAIDKPVFDGGTTTIPFFPLGDSPLALTGPSRPGMFMSAVGRRAIAMGTEDGRSSSGAGRIKWLHDFELTFKVPKYTAADPRPFCGALDRRSAPKASRSNTRTRQFTVRQHIFVPLDQPAIIMLLEVDAIRPMEIVARFTADIHYAWPAGLGGQYLVWEQNARAFLFSEEQSAVNAFLGSPAVTAGVGRAAHMLAAEPTAVRARRRQRR